MDKFKLTTSMQFPFFKFNELVTYSEVKKPSGIAYILLVLINESKSKTDKLTNVLENFGVPKSLHYIFAENITKLIEDDILQCAINFYPKEFDNYRIIDFNFTDKGKKIFAEESIPTGVNKDTKILIYYDIAKNEFSLKLDYDLEGKPLMNCALTPEFMNQFKCNKDIETFLNLRKGKDISIKKEEIITNIEQLNCENWVCKYGCEINIDHDNLEIKFDDLLLQKFFESNYNNLLINQIISFKKKFNFKSSYHDNLKLGNYTNFIDRILIPNELDQELNKKSRLIITKGNYTPINGYKIINEECINRYDDNIEFIQVDLHDSIFAYIPGFFKFNNCIFGEIKLPLVLKLKMKLDELRELVKPYIESIKEYSEENFKQLIQLTKITGDIETSRLVMDGYFDNDYERNIVCLNEMKQYALSYNPILEYYKLLLKNNYDSYIDYVTEDNLETTLKITSLIPKFLNISNKEVLDKIFKKIKIKNTINIYEILVNNGFDKSLVVSYVNPIPEIIDGVETEDKSLLDFINFNRNINELKEITGIFDYKNYDLDEENINNVNFKIIYNSQYNLYKNIEFLKNENINLFNEYDGFLKIFKLINDDINVLEDAMKNPNNIKMDLIDKKISSGDYQFVFVNLSAKLEIILKNKFGLNGKLSNMLSEARRLNLIERNIISDLHEFRENRNAYIHPEDRDTNFKTIDLKRWCNEIFALEEDEK